MEVITSSTDMHILHIEDIAIVSRTTDGYINATQLCQAGNKQFHTYYRRQKTKEFLQELSIILKCERKSLIIYKQGGNIDRATWVHPQVAINIAQWISIQFDVQVSKWIYSWYTKTEENAIEFYKQLNSIKPKKHERIEKIIQEKLRIELIGTPEVTTEYGNIDLLTKTQVIEIKELSKWKHAIGQVITYGLSQICNNKQKRIHLFAESISQKDIKIIKHVTDQLDIILTFEEYTKKNTIEETKQNINQQNESNENQDYIKKCPGKYHETEDDRMLNSSKFHKNRSTKDGFAAYCKECASNARYSNKNHLERKALNYDRKLFKYCPGTTHKCAEDRIISLQDFHNNKAARDSKEPYCKECIGTRKHGEQRKRRIIVEKEPPAKFDEDTLKWCRDCDQILNREEFHQGYTTKDGLQGYCKECHKKRRKQN